jgi:putative colanic acid biosynthesis UDP-glucose lipid carrier transferase
MQTRYIYLLRYVLMVTDLIMLNLVYLVAFKITVLLGKTVSAELSQHYIVVCNLTWLFNTAVFGLYNFNGTRRLESIYRGTWRSIALHMLLFTAYLMLAKNMNFSKTFLVVFYTILGFSFILNRFLGTMIQYRFLDKFKMAKKVAVMGSNLTAERIAAYFKKQENIHFYGTVCDDNLMYSTPGTGATAISSRLAEVACLGVMDIYVAIKLERMPEVVPLIEEAERQCIRLKFIPDFEATLGSPYTVTNLGGEFPMITLRHEPLEEMGSRFKKRLFDLMFSTLVIVFILSWLFPLLAILIKLQSKGPVLFKQKRTGRNDETFWCYKFRSMKVNDRSDVHQASKEDDRITPLGRIMRRTSMDELPQFFNVFIGNMSVVGPRPHMLKHTQEYKEIISQYMVRQFLKPGITGLAQVNGFRGETKDRQAMENRVKLDIYYLENWTAMFDVKIVFMTIINLMKGEDNAY